MYKETKYDIMKRQAAALFVCMAGLLTLSVVNIFTQHSNALLHRQAETIAHNWAAYVGELGTGLAEAISTHRPDKSILLGLQRGAMIHPVRDVAILDGNGNTAISYTVPQPAPATQAATARPDVDPSTIYRATAPILSDSRQIGILKISIDQSHTRGLLLQVAREAALEILVLVNLALLGCWFLYTLLARAAKQHSISQTRHDELTGLPSRIGFAHELQSRLQKPVTDPSHTASRPAILVVKIDRFREINDTFGHACADEVLRAVADVLHRSCGSQGFAARLSGNTFGVFLPSVAGREEAEQWASNINLAISALAGITRQHIHLKASIGIALHGQDGTDYQTLLQRADLAQFIAHQRGGNQYAFYDHDTATAFAEMHHLETLVEDACDNDLFELHFQPLYCLAPQRLCGFEALARMRDENGNFVPPDKFIAIAESLNRIEQLGAWVINKACETACHWPEPLSVAVNLSPVQFEAGNLVETVHRALVDTGLDPQRLELEVTEGLMLSDTESIRDQLFQLQDMGIKIALDDFGTGYSSLSYLWQFPFDKIKIDRSFVAGMEHSDQAAGILMTMVELARTMKLPITAEGIETIEQLERLTQLGCDTGQGYYLGKPQSATEIAASIIVDFRKQLGTGDNDDTHRTATSQKAAG